MEISCSIETLKSEGMPMVKDSDSPISGLLERLSRFISRLILLGREARGDPSGRSARQALDVLVAERLEQQHCGERLLSHVA